jgi:hypothetical protein
VKSSGTRGISSPSSYFIAPKRKKKMTPECKKVVDLLLPIRQKLTPAQWFGFLIELLTEIAGFFKTSLPRQL